MVLIPTHVREELRCLLNFMRVAAEDEAVKLSVKVKSRAARALLELRAAKKPKNLHQTPDDTPVNTTVTALPCYLRLFSLK